MLFQKEFVLIVCVPIVVSVISSIFSPEMMSFQTDMKVNLSLAVNKINTIYFPSRLHLYTADALWEIESFWLKDYSSKLECAPSETYTRYCILIRWSSIWLESMEIITVLRPNFFEMFDPIFWLTNFGLWNWLICTLRK